MVSQASQQILRIEGLQKYYGPKLILDNLAFSLNRGERAVIVGENGSGKTTLIRLIIGEQRADAGSIMLADGVTIGYLPQAISSDGHISVQTYIEQAIGVVNDLRRQMRQLEQQMSLPLPDDELAVVLAHYGTVQAQFEQLGGFEIDSRIDKVMNGLNIDYIDRNRSLMTLSGGERTRVALTGLLLRAPDLLILDEPTNHLDFAGITWLESYLAQYPHALLVVTHDRTFINAVATQISELNPTSKRLHHYHGNYEDYLAQRKRAYQAQVAAYNEQNNTRKALQRFITVQSHNTGARSNSYRNESDKHIRFGMEQRSDKTRSKKIADARGRLAALDMERMDNPRHEWTIDFRFDPVPLGSAEPLRFEHVSKSFAGKVLFQGIDATIRNGERVVLVAPNGAGKSTLLRLIMGYLTPDSGQIHCSPSAIIGYLDQDGETLKPQQTVLDCYREVTQGSDQALLAELHRSGLFSDSTLADKQVSELSVGQRRKLGLARLIAARANLLLLDEPTNHLDLLSLEALESALINFGGTLLAVSHDRRFVTKVATRIWKIDQQQLVEEIVS